MFTRLRFFFLSLILSMFCLSSVWNWLAHVLRVAKQKRENINKYKGKLYSISKKPARVQVHKFFMGAPHEKCISKNFTFTFGVFHRSALSSSGSIFIECLPGVSYFLYFLEATALCGCLKQLTGPTDRLMYVDSPFCRLPASGEYFPHS